MPARLPPERHHLTPAELRGRSDQFRRLAEVAHDEIIYRELLRLADTYLVEAEELERRRGGAAAC